MCPCCEVNRNAHHCTCKENMGCKVGNAVDRASCRGSVHEYTSASDVDSSTIGEVTACSVDVTECYFGVGST